MLAKRVSTSAAVSRVAFPSASRPCLLRVAQPKRFVVRAEEPSTSSTTSEATTIDSEKVLKDLQEKWDKVENKGQVAAYGAGALVALWLSNTLVGAINNVPLLPKLMELIGLAYSAWFTYRYLLFKSSREELAKDVENLKQKISGSN